MRAISLLAATALIAATAACQVSEDKNNGTTSVEFNEQVATETAADVGNAATNIAGTIAADAKREADKVKDRVGDVDVDVDINRNNNAPVTADCGRAGPDRDTAACLSRPPPSIAAARVGPVAQLVRAGRS